MKRYTVTYDCDYGWTCNPLPPEHDAKALRHVCNSKDEFVLASDYDTAIQERDAARKEIAKWRDNPPNPRDVDYPPTAEQLSALPANLRKWAFEAEDAFDKAEHDYLLGKSVHALTQERDTAHSLRNQIAAENKRLFAKNLELQRERDAALKDAQRYRWLRDHWDEPEVAKLHPWDDFSPDPDQLDEQIDAALSRGSAEGGVGEAGKEG